MPLAALLRPQSHRHFWSALVTAVSVGLSAAPWIVSFGPVSGEPGGLIAAAVVAALPGILMMRASRRPEIATRLRHVLVLLSLSMLLAAAGNLLRFLDVLGMPLPSVPGVGLGSTLAIWLMGFLALLRLPLMPAFPGNKWRIATDITIAGLGMALVIFVMWTLPGLRHAPAAMRREIMMFNVMAAGNIVILNLILVRRPLREVRRAVAWIAATAVIETIYLVAFQYGIGRLAHDDRLTNSLFFVDYLVYFYAARAFLDDTQPGLEIPLRPIQVWSINLLPVLAVLGVGGLLIVAALQGLQADVIVLSAGIVLMTVLLLGRVTMATAENLGTIERKASDERRIQSERMELVGRLSGNIAHVLQTLVADVRHHAEQLRGHAWQIPQMAEGIQAIGEATRKSSALAERLLLASGNGRTRQAPKRLGDVVRRQQEAMKRMVGDKRIMIWDVAKDAGNALVAPADTEIIVRELVANAGEATFYGGRIVIRVHDENLTARHPVISPRPLPGLYSVLEVSDTGRGFTEDELPHIVEPFYARKPSAEGRGLGLSIVHGIAARYGGGLHIETMPGSGSRVRVYLRTAEPRPA
jgi:signal transduction histidine kinase